VLKSELASKVAERDPARALAEIRDVERISREALQEVRGAVRGYRAERLEDEVARGRAALAAIGVTVHADIAPLGDAGTSSPRWRSRCARPSPTSCGTRTRALRGPSRAARRTACASSSRTTVSAGAHAEGSGLSGMRARLAQSAAPSRSPAIAARAWR
jgi:two-component system, NarL family, sensor histidine kinase DesK